MDIIPDKLDEESVAIYLEVPGSQIVELQAHFELYEGIGLLRTISVKQSLVCVITTLDMLEDCKALLYSLRDGPPDNTIQNGASIQWRAVQPPADQETRLLYHGYQKKGKEI